ncbi:GNAT family N-acetyltransferase [Leifsonia poae]|uniref:GNAT family N-acetyltransferase n=1 Tax=Leifsonia poae TaxID=110933 RepID=UPI003D66F8F0
MPLPRPRRPRFLRGAHLPSQVDAPVLRTQRLVLRPHRMENLEAWTRIENDPAIQNYLHWPKRSEAEVRSHLRDRTRKTSLYQADDFLALAVELDGALIGDVSMHLRTVLPEGRSVEVGWLQLPDYRGKGYATEAAEALLDFAFRKVGALWVTAVIDVDNESSMALARRLGFERIAAIGDKVTFLTTEERTAQATGAANPAPESAESPAADAPSQPKP